MKIRNSIRIKLSIILVVMILLPLVVTSYIVMTGNFNTINENVYRENMDMAMRIRNEIELLMNDTDIFMETLSNLDMVKSMDSHQMNNLLLETVKASDIITQIYVMDKTGMQIYKTSGTLGNRADRQYFKSSIKGETHFSDVIISKTTGKPIVTLSKPIEGEDSIIGVIGASISLDYLSVLLDKTKTGEYGYGFIVERNGKIIAHPNRSLVEEETDVSYLDPVKEVIVGDTGRSEYVYEEIEKLASYTYIDKTGWGVVFQLPREEAFYELKYATKFFIITISVAVIVALIVSILISNYITNPLVDLKQKCESASKGDLTVSLKGKIIKRNDEFGLLAKGFNTMINANNGMIKNLIESSSALTDSSKKLNEIVEQNAAAMEEIASGTGLLAMSAEEDSKATKDGAGALKQVAAGAENVAMNTERLNETVKKSVDAAVAGVSMMDETSKAVEEVSQISNEINVKMEGLETASANIGTIADTISSVAEQTNLLALNAAIEAARAGDAGKGFAVVAEEIRKLAEEVNDSAGNITNLLENMKKEVQETSNIIRETSGSLGRVVEKTNETKESIKNIEKDANNAMLAVEEIASVAQQQAASSQQVTSLMDSLLTSINNTASTTQQISASVEEQTASSEQVGSLANELSAMAENLRKLVSYYKIKG